MKKPKKKSKNKEATNYTLIEHTADIGLKVRAEDYNQLFIFAARGMFNIIGHVCRKIKSTKVYKIHTQANNKEELLISWLSELLTLSDINNILLFNFQIKSLTKFSISASAEAVDMNNPAIQTKTQIKAVTYHNVNITQKNNKLIQAQVFFDV
jgi:SHS2 domain-containing protein